jgi:hypothetical protein
MSFFLERLTHGLTTSQGLRLPCCVFCIFWHSYFCNDAGRLSIRPESVYTQHRCFRPIIAVRVEDGDGSHIETSEVGVHVIGTAGEGLPRSVHVSGLALGGGLTL